MVYGHDSSIHGVSPQVKILYEGNIDKFLWQLVLYWKFDMVVDCVRNSCIVTKYDILLAHVLW